MLKLLTRPAYDLIFNGETCLFSPYAFTILLQCFFFRYVQVNFRFVGCMLIDFHFKISSHDMCVNHYSNV